MRNERRLVARAAQQAPLHAAEAGLRRRPGHAAPRGLHGEGGRLRLTATEPTSPQAFLVSPLLATSTIAITTAITISILLSPVVHTNTSNSSTINSVENSLPLPPLLTCAFTTFTTALQIFC